MRVYSPLEQDDRLHSRQHSPTWHDSFDSHDDMSYPGSAQISRGPSPPPGAYHMQHPHGGPPSSVITYRHNTGSYYGGGHEHYGGGAQHGTLPRVPSHMDTLALAASEQLYHLERAEAARRAAFEIKRSELATQAHTRSAGASPLQTPYLGPQNGSSTAAPRTGAELSAPCRRFTPR
jgi:hypothetical protein